MMYAQIPIGGLPINLVLLPHIASVAFVKVRSFGAMFDLDYEKKGNVEALFFSDDFSLRSKDEEQDFCYNTAYDYKNIPIMLGWLQQQKLEPPNF